MVALRGLFSFVGSTLPALALVVLILVVAADVAARNIFQVPLYIAHDIALLAFSLMVWFGLVGCAVTGQLIGIEALVAFFPGPWRLGAKLLVHFLLAAIAIAVIQASVAQIATSRFSTYLALGWPKWLVAAGLAVSMVVLVIFHISSVIALARGKSDAP